MCKFMDVPEVLPNSTVAIFKFELNVWLKENPI
jgi:hypothetical protein